MFSIYTHFVDSIGTTPHGGELFVSNKIPQLLVFKYLPISEGRAHADVSKVLRVIAVHSASIEMDRTRELAVPRIPVGPFVLFDKRIVVA
jgi:hypothetical protein